MSRQFDSFLKAADNLDKSGFYHESDALTYIKLSQKDNTDTSYGRRSLIKNKQTVQLQTGTPLNISPRAQAVLKKIATDGIGTLEVLKEWYALANNVPRTVIERYPGLSPKTRNLLLTAGDYADQGLDFAQLVKNDFAPLKSAATGLAKVTGVAAKASEIAAKNPKLASAAAKLITPLARFFPALQNVASGGFIGPWAGIIITLAFSYPKIMEYLKAANDGTFKQKYIDDAEERAQLFELMSNLVGQRLLLIPGMQVIGGALLGASMVSSGGRQLAQKMYGDESRDKIATTNFIANTKADFVNLFRSSDPEVQKVAQPIFKMIRQNPYMKNIEILNLPEVTNVSWVKDKSSTANQLKYAQFMGLIISLRKIFKAQKI